MRSCTSGSDHVFGIPLMEVVENDQLLRLQTLAPPQDSLHPGEGKTPDGFSGQTLGQHDGSPCSSCSGSSSSINNHQPLHNDVEQTNVRRRPQRFVGDV